MKYIFTFFALTWMMFSQAQVVINEADADQASTDTQEFIELYGTPNMALDGYVVVLFNGANDQSYGAYDLDGYTIPSSGYFVLGVAAVPNVNYVVTAAASGFIQNGADAIGLYLGDATAWATGTAVSNTGLVDALVYGTADADDAELIAALCPGQVQVDEGAANNTSSCSRIPDGGAALNLALWSAQNPTPGASNSGVISGCMDNTACNYNPNATVDAGGCLFPGDACNDNNSMTTDDIYDGSCVCAGTPISGSSIAIAEVSTVGSSVTVTGIVINGAEMGSSVRYIQDNQAGIAIYPGLDWSAWGSTPLRGDEITVTGILTEYNGLLEVGSTLTAVSINSNSNTLPTPQLMTPVLVNEDDEGELVMIENVVFDLAGSSISGNSTYTYTSGAESGVIYIRNGSVLVGTNLPASAVTMVGIVSQFDATSPYDSGYQILPRDSADFILPPGVAIIGPVSQTNINTTSFDLNWVTNNNSNSIVHYGLTPALGDSVVVNNDVTSHTVSIPNLLPGTIYYASVTSTNADGSSSSTVRPYATKSLSSGIIRAYFNQSVDNSVSSGENAMDIGTASNDTIAAYIARATQSLDIAIYNITDDPTICNAINARYNAGVQVRMIVDGSTAAMGLGLLNAGIPVVQRNNTGGATGIMHNKFIIVDADITNNAWVFTGSMNWTETNMYNDYNNIIIFQDQSLARGYRLEFEEMWGGSGPQPGVSTGVFAAAKTANTPVEYVLGPNNIRVESYFSPTDNANGAIVRTIQTTDTNLDYAVLAFTRTDIADAIIAEDDLFLVLVRGLIEQTSDAASEYTYLQNAGQSVFSYEAIPYDLHHKYCIVDHSSLDSDPTVLTGSHNWSSAAQTTNDENTVVVHDARIANLYLQEFTARWGQVGVNELEKGAMNVYPNPTVSSLWIALPKGHSTGMLTVYDIQGQVVLQHNLTSGLQQVTLPALASGNYVCKVDANNISWTKQVVVK